MNADKHGSLKGLASGRLFANLRSSALTCGSNFLLFLRGALSLAFPVARCTKHDARSYSEYLSHKYSRPTRCC